MINALTIDVEEWYHICGLEEPIKFEDWPDYESRVRENMTVILDILSRGSVKATFFILGYIAERFPEVVKDIDSQGHEIATHGFGHNLIYQQKPDEFTIDLKKSIDILKNITGKEVLGHRAASFSVTDESLWALDILINCGIKYDCSIFPIKHPRYGIPLSPRFPYQVKEGLMEFTPSTIKILGKNLPVAGGPVLRLLPYGVSRWAIKMINNQGKPALIYIHPWEIDPSFPKLDLPLTRKFTRYVNLKSTKAKLCALLQDFEFAPVKEVLKI